MKSDNTENKLDLAPAEAEEGEIPAVAAAPELPKQKKSKKKLILIAVIVVVVLFLLSRMLGGGSGIPMGGNYTAEAAAHRDLSVTDFRYRHHSAHSFQHDRGYGYRRYSQRQL